MEYVSSAHKDIISIRMASVAKLSHNVKNLILNKEYAKDATKDINSVMENASHSIIMMIMKKVVQEEKMENV